MKKNVIAPTCEQLWNEELDEVSENLATWRHGHRVTQVFHRESDDTYWQAEYRRSSDGGTNELREGYAEITQVTPEQTMVTHYVAVTTIPPVQTGEENNDG
jgi:hypothetical protein